MNYRKRRRIAGANKNEEKVRRSKAEMSRPTLASRFPTVESLSIALDFFTKDGTPMSREVLQVGQADPVELAVDCPGPCWDGKIDLEKKLAAMVEQREPQGQGGSRCPEPAYPSADVCGCELRCQIKVSYRP